MACTGDVIPVRIKTEVMEENSANACGSFTQLPAHNTQNTNDLCLDTNALTAHCGKAETSTCSDSARDETSCYDNRNTVTFSKDTTSVLEQNATLAYSDPSLMGTGSNNGRSCEIEDTERHPGSTPSTSKSVVKAAGPNFALSTAIKTEVKDSKYDVAACSSGNGCAHSEEDVWETVKREVVDHEYDTADRANGASDSTLVDSTCERDESMYTRSARVSEAGDDAVDRSRSEYSFLYAPVKCDAIDTGIFPSQLDVHKYEQSVDGKSPGKYDSTNKDMFLDTDFAALQRTPNDHKVFTLIKQNEVGRQRYSATADRELKSQDDEDYSASQISDSEASNLYHRHATLPPLQKKRKHCNQKAKLTCESLSHCIVCSLSASEEKELTAHTKGKKIPGLKNTKLLTDIRDKHVSLNRKNLFQCKNCDRSFMFAADLLSHLTYHDEMRPRALFGSANRKRGKGKRKIKTVMTRKPKNKPFKETQNASVEARTCAVCGSVFSSVQTLQIHIKNPNQPLLDTLKHQGISERGNFTPDSEGKNSHRTPFVGTGHAKVNPKKICHSKSGSPDSKEGASELCLHDCPSKDSQFPLRIASFQSSQPTDERFSLVQGKTSDKETNVKRQSETGIPIPEPGPDFLLETPPLTCGCTSVPRQHETISSPSFSLVSLLETGRVRDDQKPRPALRRRKRHGNLATRHGQKAVPGNKVPRVNSQNWDGWFGNESALKKGQAKKASNAAVFKQLWIDQDDDISPSARTHSDLPLPSYPCRDPPLPPDRYSDLSSLPDRNSDLSSPSCRDSDLSPPPNRDSDLSPPPNRDSDLSSHSNSDSDLSPPPNPHTDLQSPSYKNTYLPPFPNRDSKLPPPSYRNKDPPPPQNLHSSLAPRHGQSRTMEAAGVPGPRPVENPFLCKYCCQHFATAEQHDEHQAAEHTEQTRVKSSLTLPAYASQLPANPATLPQYSQTLRRPIGNVKDVPFPLPHGDCNMSLTWTSDAHAVGSPGVPRRVVNKLPDTNHSRKRLTLTSLTGQRSHLKRLCVATHPVTYFLTTPEDSCIDAADHKDAKATELFISSSSSKPRMFSCRYCEGAFSTPQGLSAHQRVHIKSRPHDCNECTQRFTTSHELDLHKRTQHAGCMPFLCTLCNATFPTSKGANIHQAKHERERAAKESACMAKITHSHKSEIVPDKVYIPLTASVIVLAPKSSCSPDASAAIRRETDHSDDSPVSGEAGHLNCLSACRQAYDPDDIPTSLESSTTSSLSLSLNGSSRAQKTPFTIIKRGPSAASGVKAIAGTKRNRPKTVHSLKGSVDTFIHQSETGKRPVTAVALKAGHPYDQEAVLTTEDKGREERGSLVFRERVRAKPSNLRVKKSYAGSPHSGANSKQRRKLTDTQLSPDRDPMQMLSSKGSGLWVEKSTSQGYVEPAHIAKDGSVGKSSCGLTLHFEDTQPNWSELSTPFPNKRRQFKEKSSGRDPSDKQYNTVPRCTSCKDVASHGSSIASAEEHTCGMRSHREDVKNRKGRRVKHRKQKNMGKDNWVESHVIFPNDKAENCKLCPRCPDSNKVTACTPSTDARKASVHKCHLCKKKFFNARRLWQHRLTHFSELM